MESPLVSIFVQTYQHEAFIGECVASILGQQGGHSLEVIVVDDGSKDRTAEVVRAVRDSRVRLIAHERNAGVIATANEGYAAARGKYVARIDGDDRYRPHFLERVIPVLEQHPAVGVVYGDIAMVDPQGRLSSTEGCVRTLRQARPLIGNELLPLLCQNFIPAPGTIARRDVWEAMLPIPQHLHYLDYYMTTQAAHVWEFAYVDEVLADYRIHPGNQHSRMVLDGTGERSTLDILAAAYARPEYSKEKTKQRRQIFARVALSYGDKYFGTNLLADARRCYWRAFQWHPMCALDSGALRRLVATYMKRSFYEAIKVTSRQCTRRFKQGLR